MSSPERVSLLTVSSKQWQNAKAANLTHLWLLQNIDPYTSVVHTKLVSKIYLSLSTYCLVPFLTTTATL
jgi:hypothetical protein